MTKLMKKGCDLIEGEERRFCICRPGEVCNYRDEGSDIYPFFFALFTVSGHPGTAVLPGSRKVISIKDCKKSIIGIMNLPCFYFTMVNRYRVVPYELDTIKFCRQGKYCFLCIFQYKKWFKDFIVNVKFCHS